MATIRSKILINVIITLLTITVIITLNWLHQRETLKMQETGLKRFHDAIEAKEASMGGLGLYRIIADAQINRDLKNIPQEWAAKKSEVLGFIEQACRIADTPEERRETEQVRGAITEIIRLFEMEMLPRLTAGNPAGELRELDERIDAQVEKVESGMDRVVASLEREVKAADINFKAEVRQGMLQSLAIGLVGVILQAGLASWLLRSIMRPIRAMVALLRDISGGAGDLTIRLDDSSRDEIAEASRYFNLFVEKLRGIIGQVSLASQDVASASSQLHATAEQMATGVEEVAAQAATVATAGEEMSATSGDIAQNCQLAAEGSQRASYAAVSGARVVDETILVINSIAERVRNSARAVESLGSRSDQIGAIVGTIEDIADQTNLLALNAAIEAARAGEQGRGFAVVADEVRALAERTTRATREIGEMIKSIQTETRAAVTAMEEGVREVATGSARAADSGTALEQILEQINAVTLQIAQVATAAEQQTATTSEISSNMQQITEVVAQTASGAHESAAASNQLSGLAEDLRRIVSQFKTA